ncbi:MAG: alkaline phosphatase family protein [Pirellulales bacterium]
MEALEARVLLAVDTFPALAAQDPIGSLVYEGNASADISAEDTSDSFTIDLDAGQSVSVYMQADAPLKAELSVDGPASDPFDVITSAAAAGEDLLLQNLQATDGGTYTIGVTGLDSTTGNYSIRVVLNAAIEEEPITAQANDALADAQDLDGAFTSLSGTADRAAVSGELDSVLSQDWYRFSLDDGQTASLALSPPGVSLELYDDSGNLLAHSVTTANAGQRIGNFVDATSDGSPNSYFARVSGTDSSYLLLVTRGADFDAEPNDAVATAQDISLTGTVLGGSSSGASLPGGSGTPIAGATDIVGSPIALGFAADGSFSGPSIGIQHNGVEYINFGTFLASYTVGFNGSNFTNGAPSDGTAFGVTLANLSSGSRHTIRATGNVTPNVGFERIVVWNEGDDHALVYTTLTNNTAAPLNNVAFLENLDPDPGSVFSSNNDVTAGGELVVASGDGAGAIGLGSVDPQRVVSAEGFSNQNPFDIINSPEDPNGGTNDIAISLAFDAGALAPGASVTKVLAMVFGSNQAAVEARYAEIAEQTTGMAEDLDHYSIPVLSGDTLQLDVTTPGGGAGEPVNLLDAAIELYDPSGVLVASDASGSLSHSATSSGTYTVRVLSENDTSGEYVLTASGYTGAPGAYEVTSSTPADGAFLTAAPSVFLVELSDSVLATSLTGADLSINGATASAVTIVDGDTLEFVLPALADGVHEFEIAAGSIQALDGRPIEAFTGQITIDATAPRVIDSSIQQNETVAAGGSLVYTVVFDETLNAAVLGPTDVQLTGQVNGPRILANFDYDPVTSTLTLQYDNLPEDLYTLRLISGDGRFEDPSGNNLDGEPLAFPIPPNSSGDGSPGGDFVLNFATDTSSLPFPTPLQPVDPLGSQAYTGEVQGVIGLGDTDSFTIDLDGGQSFSLLVVAGDNLRAELTIEGPASDPFEAVVAASAAGENVLAQSLTATEPGTYTISVAGLDDTIGFYAVRLLLNSALEEEGHSGAANDSLTDAQSLESDFIPAGSGASERAALTGGLATEVDQDWYSFTLEDGGVASVLLAELAGGPATFELYNAAGELLATGPSQTDEGSAIHNFVDATSDGGADDYFVRVHGMSADYNLLVTRGGDFERLTSGGARQMIAGTGFQEPNAGASTYVAGTNGDQELGFGGSITTGVFAGVENFGGGNKQYFVWASSIQLQTDAVAIGDYQDIEIAIDVRTFEDSSGSDWEGSDSLRVFAELSQGGGPVTVVEVVPTTTGGSPDRLKALELGSLNDGPFTRFDVDVPDGNFDTLRVVIQGTNESSTERYMFDNLEITGVDRFLAQPQDISLTGNVSGGLQFIPGAIEAVQEKLTAEDAAAGDWYGFSNDMDGNLAVVGATGADANGSGSGAAYILEFIDGGWQQVAKLTPDDGLAGDAFGWSVAIDGQRVLVSAPRTDTAGSNSGSVYVFELVEGVWQQTAKLESLDAAGNDLFGYSVALEGNRALVGALSSGGTGAAYIFEGGGGTWSQVKKLVAGDAEANDRLGSSVDLQGDLAVAGAFQTDTTGAAYIFERSGADWTQIDKLTANDAAGLDRFGASISIDGDWLAIGASEDDDRGSSSGAVYLFQRSGPESWEQMRKLVPNDSAAGDRFGNSLDLQGGRLLVGAILHSDGATGSGAAYLFEQMPAGWMLVDKLTADDAGGSDRLGQSVALDGDRFMAGAYFNEHPEAGNEAGAVYSFSFPLFDEFVVSAQSGDMLSLTTYTPGDQPGEPVNSLVPRLQLVDPDGVLVAQNAGGAADGHNALVMYEADKDGLYTVRILSSQAGVGGEYALEVDGATGPLPGFEVIDSDVADGSVLVNAPNQVTLRFNERLRLDTLAAGDLQVDGQPALGFTLVDSYTVQFDLPVLTDGEHSLTIDAGMLLNLQGTAVSPFALSFDVDQTGPRVISATWNGGAFPANAAFDEGPLSVTFTFDEELRQVANSLNANDVLLFNHLDGTSTGASSFLYNTETDTVTATFPELLEGLYTLTLLSGDGAFEDAFGNDLDGEPLGAVGDGTPSGDGTRGGNYNIDLFVDGGDEAVPLPELEQKAPLGSLIYDPTVSGAIGPGGDTDSFTIDVDPDQTITVVVVPQTPGLRPQVTLHGPAGDPFTTSASAPAVDSPAVLQTVAATLGGTYTIDVQGLDDSFGVYTIQVVLNAAVELEEHSEAGNDTFADAQDLDGSFIDLAGGLASRGAVIGQVPPALGISVVGDDFESGGLSGAWTASSSTSEGRIRVTGAEGTAGGSFALLMDTIEASSGGFVLNEAIWTVDLNGVLSPTLSFSHAEWGDEQETFSGPYTGSVNADGVSISADGVNWHPVLTPDEQSTGEWAEYTVDLAAEATAAGISLGENFRIKFQQYDNFPIATDGRGYDEIRISTPAVSDDWYSFTLADGQLASFAMATRTPGHVELELYDASQTLIASGSAAEELAQVLTNFQDTTTDGADDRYYLRVTGFNAAYSLIVMRDGNFDTELNDSLAEAQDISQTGVAMGHILDNSSNGGGPLVDHVIQISIDGLRSDLLENLVNSNPSQYSNFLRLENEASFTFNARTDYTHSITLPNHTSMLTGRPVLNPAGQPNTTGHQWTTNSDPSPSQTLHNNNPFVSYISSTFDVAHDAGLLTRHYANKTKFSIYTSSYNAANGAPDSNPVGGDNGTDKIDQNSITASLGGIIGPFVSALNSTPEDVRTYNFLHFADPDGAGHSSGWGSSVWEASVRSVDAYLGQLFNAITSNPELAGNTALIITADHGGTGFGHGSASDPLNYTIPFYVWGPGFEGGDDLYDVWSDTVADPGTGRPDYNAENQPIRNGSGGNLAMALLGLEQIPGSSIVATGSVEAASDLDYYRFDAVAGDHLVIETFTPAGGAGQVLNELDPTIELYDPNGILVATADGGAPDSRNVHFEYDAEMAGTYRVVVRSNGEPDGTNRGEYVLSVQGATGGTNAPPQVANVNPGNGATVTNFPTTYVVDFSETIRATSVQASDLVIGGLPATDVEAIDGDSFRFTVDAAANVGDGTYTVEMAEGAVADLLGEDSVAFSGSFNLDTTPPVILSATFNGGAFPSSGIFQDGPLTVTFTFSEDLGDTPINDDFVLFDNLSGTTFVATDIQYDSGTDVLELQFPFLPEGVYTLTLISGDEAFEDLHGNDLDGEPLGASPAGTPTGNGDIGGHYSLNFTVDRLVSPAAPFARLAPLGGLMFSSTGNAGLINSNTDTDRISFFLQSGETISAVVTPENPAATLSVKLSSGAIYTAPGPGEPVVLPPTVLISSGLRSLLISGDAPTEFEAVLYRNASLEALVGDSDPAEPMPLDNSLIQLDSGRFGVIGRSDLPTLLVDTMVWAVQPSSGEILQIDPITGIVFDRFPAPDALAAGHTNVGLSMAEEGDSLLYVNGDIDPAVLYRLNPENGAVLSVETVAAGPDGRGLSFAGGTPHSIFLSGPDVSRQAGYSGGLSSHLATADFDALGGDDSGRQFAYSAADGMIREFSATAPDTVTNSFAAPGGGPLLGLAFADDDLYAVNAAGDLFTLNPDTGAILDVVTISGGALVGLGAFRPVGTTVQDEPNDTVANVVSSGLIGGGIFTDNGTIGDNPEVPANRDVDLIEVRLNAGDRIIIDVDAAEAGSSLDPMLGLFNAAGVRLSLSDDTPAPGEPFTLDPYIDFTVASTGVYYVGVSGFSNSSYNIFTPASGSTGDTGPYNIQISVNTTASPTPALLSARGFDPELKAAANEDDHDHEEGEHDDDHVEASAADVARAWPAITTTGAPPLAAALTEVPLPDVDAYTIDLTGKVGETLDFILDGQVGADFSGELMELLDVDGTTVLATGLADPLGTGAANYDQGILGFTVPADGVYMLRITSSVAGEYGLLVTDSVLFDTEPNDEAADTLRSLDGTGAALGFLGGSAGVAFADPAGDTYGSGAGQVDIASIQASVVGENVVFRAVFHHDISPDATINLIELDLDQNPSTGEPSIQGQLSPPGQQGGPLGVEIYVQLVNETTAAVLSLSGGNPTVIGTVPATFESNAYEIAVPLALIGDDGALNYGFIVGSSTEPTDSAPDTEVGTTASVGGTPVDQYSLSAVAGQVISISTETLFDHASGNPLNELDPSLELLGPDGSLLAADANGLDGKDARIQIVAPESGIYTIRVLSESGIGEYLLHADALDAPAVVGRHVFYNNSWFDNDNPAANADDDLALAPDKHALLPGQSADFANYTNYSKGLNGVMIDVLGLAGTPDLDDFTFTVGNSNDTSTWSAAPDPVEITVRPGEGVLGSDRITLIWADEAIRNEWLSITVEATDQTGLTTPDVFYFGNAVGEVTQPTQGHTIVDPTDQLAIRNNTVSSFLARNGLLEASLIDSRYDINRDSGIDAADELIARNNGTSSLDTLKLIVPMASSEPVASPLTGRAAAWATQDSESEPQQSLAAAPLRQASLGRALEIDERIWADDDELAMSLTSSSPADSQSSDVFREESDWLSHWDLLN